MPTPCDLRGDVPQVATQRGIRLAAVSKAAVQGYELPTLEPEQCRRPCTNLAATEIPARGGSISARVCTESL